MSAASCKQTGRRKFIRRSCAAVAGVPFFGASCSRSEERVGIGNSKPLRQGNRDISRVVSRSDAKVFAAHGHDERRVRDLVNRAVSDLVGVKDHREAFRALFAPDDVVAIKLNCLAGLGMSSSVSVVDALVAGLRSIGIENRHIILWERSSAELSKAGFKVNRLSNTRPRCYGNDDGGFERRIVMSGEVGSLWTNVLAKRATALINVPVLKDHDLSGVGCGMKNMYGAIHNPNRYHENNCDPYIAHVCAHPYIKDKLRLVLADALTAQYQGGPARVLEYQWRPAKILAARDPVALDTVAGGLIEKQRAAHGMASLEEAKKPPKWLKTANRMGLGENDLKKILLDRG
ncbi:MAG: DUF362 domain-containing protein [Proteobacteria bacterium]|nr:DUF362 domain-containing protein [Pseudomonadota bacterium]